jgi:hypothetical protein
MLAIAPLSFSSLGRGVARRIQKMAVLRYLKKVALPVPKAFVSAKRFIFVEPPAALGRTHGQ